VGSEKLRFAIFFCWKVGIVCCKKLTHFFNPLFSSFACNSLVVSCLFTVRNPINNITLAAELAVDIISKIEPQDKTLNELLDNISRSAEAAGHVLNDALNLQRLQNGTFEFVHKPFLLVDSFMQVVRMMRPQMSHKAIEVSIMN
jgi:signal transduction histidine kinase